jgi:hypothetical protein
MSDDDIPTFVEADPAADERDPDEIPVRDRKVVTQPYDLAVHAVNEQIKNETIFLRPLSDRPSFQRKYVWTDKLASKLIESILLKVPIPPIYLSQNDDFELDVIDGQQRIYSLYRFTNNQFALRDLDVLKELNGTRFFELDGKIRRQIETHTLRCVLVTNESHPEIKFEVFERLNTNTAPLNAQELRNCIYRGSLNEILKNCVEDVNWRSIVGRARPDKRMREEEIALRFYAFKREGLASYRTPLKFWLNSAAKNGRSLKAPTEAKLQEAWSDNLQKVLAWFEPAQAFRRPDSRAINRALFDLTMRFADNVPSVDDAKKMKAKFRARFKTLMADGEFNDLISRAVDHTKRTRRRFEIWDDKFANLV